MLGQPNLTEKILTFLANLDNALDYPKSFGQLLNWDKHQYYKNRKRLKTQVQRERKRIQEAARRLEKTASLTYDKKMNQYRLTPTGWLKFMQYYKKRNTKNAKQRGVEKYFIIWDIPEEHRRFRNLFRECLANLGCHMEQKSVFQTNDPTVFKFAQKIVSNCDLDGYVKFIEAKNIF